METAAYKRVPLSMSTDTIAFDNCQTNETYDGSVTYTHVNKKILLVDCMAPMCKVGSEFTEYTSAVQPAD